MCSVGALCLATCIISLQFQNKRYNKFKVNFVPRNKAVYILMLADDTGY